MFPLSWTPLLQHYDMTLTEQEVKCACVYQATQFQVSIQSNFQGHPATVITQGLTIKPLKMLALSNERCCFVPVITSYWPHTWQSQYFHLRDAQTRFGYSTRKLKTSPSPNTFLRATNSFSRTDTRVTFWAKYVLTKLTQPRSRPSRHRTYFKICGTKLCSCLTENSLHCH